MVARETGTGTGVMLAPAYHMDAFELPPEHRAKGHRPPIHRQGRWIGSEIIVGHRLLYPVPSVTTKSTSRPASLA